MRKKSIMINLGKILMHILENSTDNQFLRWDLEDILQLAARALRNASTSHRVRCRALGPRLPALLPEYFSLEVGLHKLLDDHEEFSRLGIMQRNGRKLTTTLSLTVGRAIEMTAGIIISNLESIEK
jgi:hypothetical protein